VTELTQLIIATIKAVFIIGFPLLILIGLIFLIWFYTRKHFPYIKYKILKKPINPDIVEFAIECIGKKLDEDGTKKHYLLSGYPSNKYLEFLYIRKEVKKALSQNELKGGKNF
jgi:hypothetical protein